MISDRTRRLKLTCIACGKKHANKATTVCENPACRHDGMKEAGGSIESWRAPEKRETR